VAGRRKHGLCGAVVERASGRLPAQLGRCLVDRECRTVGALGSEPRIDVRRGQQAGGGAGGVVAQVLADSPGIEIVDAGGLKNARYLEPLAGLNIYLGYGAGLGTAIPPVWIRKA
jgi:hypothetical protein